MLPKANRLPSSFIPQIIHQGKRARDKFITLFFINNTSANTRFAIIIPQSTDKRSVVRNKIKRTIRESIRKQLNLITPGWDVVIMINKQKDIIKDYSNIENELLLLLSESGVGK